MRLKSKAPGNAVHWYVGTGNMATQPSSLAAPLSWTHRQTPVIIAAINILQYVTKVTCICKYIA